MHTIISIFYAIYICQLSLFSLTIHQSISKIIYIIKLISVVLYLNRWEDSTLLLIFARQDGGLDNALYLKMINHLHLLLIPLTLHLSTVSNIISSMINNTNKHTLTIVLKPIFN